MGSQGATRVPATLGYVFDRIRGMIRYEDQTGETRCLAEKETGNASQLGPHKNGR